MYFGMKSYLKSNRNHTAKQAYNINEARKIFSRKIKDAFHGIIKLDLNNT